MSKISKSRNLFSDFKTSDLPAVVVVVDKYPNTFVGRFPNFWFLDTFGVARQDLHDDKRRRQWMGSMLIILCSSGGVSVFLFYVSSRSSVKGTRLSYADDGEDRLFTGGASGRRTRERLWVLCAARSHRLVVVVITLFSHPHHHRPHHQFGPCGGLLLGVNVVVVIVVVGFPGRPAALVGRTRTKTSLFPVAASSLCTFAGPVFSQAAGASSMGLLSELSGPGETRETFPDWRQSTAGEQSVSSLLFFIIVILPLLCHRRGGQSG
jgi:hypothetical protein